MRCERARRRLMTAELEELRGEGDSPLSRHLGSCRDCGRMARRIVEMERELDGALEALAEGSPALHSTDSAPEGSGARRTQARPHGSGPEGPAPGPVGSGVRPRLRAVSWRVLVPLAAAAVAAVVLLPAGDETTPPGPGGTRGGTARPGPGGSAAAADDEAARADDGPDFHVQASGSERLVVFQPPDPSLTVVWFFGDDEDGPPDTERN